MSAIATIDHDCSGVITPFMPYRPTVHRSLSTDTTMDKLLRRLFVNKLCVPACCVIPMKRQDSFTMKEEILLLR